MNSRSAKKATMPNSTVAMVSPSAQPTQKTTDISHEVRSRPLKSLIFWLLASSSALSFIDITKP
jgi:hypothetical protein